MKNSIKSVFKSVFFTSVLFLCLTTCKNNKELKTEQASHETDMVKEPFFKLSLAQWSLHRAILNTKTHNPMDFAKKAKELGFEGLEYVSQLYDPQIESMGMQVLLDSLKAKSERHDIRNVLIMVDGEGDLADPDESKRTETIENHKKWVDAAQFLGCHSIRVNLFGTNDPVLWEKVAEDGLSRLSDYAATKNINVIVENHGWLSSNAALLMKVINKVNKPNCGTLPDFGNFCVKRKDEARWGECVEEYPDIYRGIQEMMPAAKGVSAKSYDFDANGNETKIDFKRMIQIVKDAGFKDYIGVEYEGDRLSEEEGIKATRDLLLKLAKEVN